MTVCPIRSPVKTTQSAGDESGKQIIRYNTMKIVFMTKGFLSRLGVQGQSWSKRYFNMFYFVKFLCIAEKEYLLSTICKTSILWQMTPSMAEKNWRVLHFEMKERKVLYSILIKPKVKGLLIWRACTSGRSTKSNRSWLPIQLNKTTGKIKMESSTI